MASPLQTWVTDHPRDGSAWQTLARVWRSQGQEMRALRAEAEAQVAHYDYAAAVDRFKAMEDEEQRGEFRDKLSGYVKVYSFLSQIIPYADPDLEMLYSFGRLLLDRGWIAAIGYFSRIDVEVMDDIFEEVEVTVDEAAGLYT